MWGIQKVAVIKLNSIMMLLGRKCVSEFVLVLDNFLSISSAPPCSSLLRSSSSLFAFYIGDFGWAAPLWLPWPWISEGEKKLLRSEMRSSPPNFPFILFNFEYWIIIVDHFQVMVMMECHRERRTSRQTRSGWANSPNYCMQQTYEAPHWNL